MKEETQYRSIAKLWEMLSTSMMISETFPASDAKKFEEHVASLRTELLERCKHVRDGIGNYRDLYISPSGQICNTFLSSYDTPETARNMSAAYAFWAWELEQRTNEAQKGGGE